MMRLSQIAIYPVKGMRGLQLPKGRVERLGMEGDRRYLVVDDDGVFLSQRKDPLMATLQPSYRDGRLVISSDRHGEVEIFPGKEVREVTIWKDMVRALDCGDPVADWISEALGRSCRIVAMYEETNRAIDPEFSSGEECVSFADGYPLLLCNSRSLGDINEKMFEPVPMNRFRPNLVIEGAQPWEEDAWKLILIGDVAFRSVKPCARCLVTTTDQATGDRLGDEPLRTLGRIRNVGGKAMFGINLIPNSEGIIEVGMPVSVIRDGGQVP